MSDETITRRHVPARWSEDDGPSGLSCPGLIELPEECTGCLDLSVAGLSPRTAYVGLLRGDTPSQIEFKAFDSNGTLVSWQRRPCIFNDDIYPDLFMEASNIAYVEVSPYYELCHKCGGRCSMSVSQSPWIDRFEQEPDTANRILVWFRDTVFVGEYIEGSWYEFIDDETLDYLNANYMYPGCLELDFRYWMPWPEPPKEPTK